MPYATLQDCQDHIVTVSTCWSGVHSAVLSLDMTDVVIENGRVREQQRVALLSQ